MGKYAKMKEDIKILRVLAEIDKVNPWYYITRKYIPGLRLLQKTYKNTKSKIANKYYDYIISDFHRSFLEKYRKVITLNGYLCWVSVYSITRNYGGPEEGGWWYDWWTLEKSVLTIKSKSELTKDLLTEEFSDMKHGDISSVLGGTDISVAIEDVKGENETTERPYYC